MIKIKKSILTIVLALMVVLSSMLLMACNKNNTNTDAFNVIDTTLSTYKKNSEMFGEGTVYGIQTNYKLKNFLSKDDEGNFVSDNENYVVFVAYGLNYIENNYAKLEDLVVKYDFNSIINKVEKMNDTYDLLCIEYENFINLESTANYNIYNGYFARYKEYTKAFIDEIYETASALGKFLVEQSGDGIGTENVNADTFNSYIDYHEFLISRDFKNLLMNSCNGKYFEENLYQSAENLFKGYCNNLFDQDTKALTLDEAKDIKEVLEAVNADRKNVSESLVEFSMYDFYTTYEGSLIAYEKNNEDATIYYNNIDSYFNSNGILYKLYAYLLLV